MSKAKEILDKISEVEKRPPKGWWDDCVKTMSGNPDITDPDKICGWIYHQHMSPERRAEIEKTRA